MNRFIKMNVNINSALAPEEISILVALCEQDFVMRARGKDKGWSKNYLMEVSNLGRKVFDRVAEQMVQKRLLNFTPRKGGGRNQYLLNQEEYSKMNDVLYLTNNRDALNKFFKKLWKQNRAPLDITEEEELGLKKTAKHWKTNRNGKSIIDISEYYRNSVSEDRVPEGLGSGNSDTGGDSVLSDVSPKVPGFDDACTQKYPVSEKRVPRGTRFNESVPKPGTTWGTGIEEEKKERKEKKEKESFFVKKETKKLNSIGNQVSTKMVFGQMSSGENMKGDISEHPSIKENKPNEKITDMMNDEEYMEDIHTLIQYFRERYPSGSADSLKNATEYYEELKDDYWYFSDELMESSITDVFRDFKVIGDKVFMFYEKTDDSVIKLSPEELNEFNNMSYTENEELDKISSYPEHEKIDIIVDWFNEDYSAGDVVPLSRMNQYVRSAMRDINSPELNGVKFNNPRLAPNILPNIEPTDEAQEYWMRSVEKTNSIKPRMANIIQIPSIKKKDISDFWIDENKLKEDNIYFGIFDDFRITRRMDTSDISQMTVLMLKFAFIDAGTTICMEDMQKLMYALANRIEADYTSREFMEVLESVFIKENDNEFKIEY